MAAHMQKRHQMLHNRTEKPVRSRPITSKIDNQDRIYSSQGDASQLSNIDFAMTMFCAKKRHREQN